MHGKALEKSGEFVNLTGDALDLAIIAEISSQVKIHHKVELEQLMIQKISRVVFRNFTHLESISLRVNRIETIEDEAFKENKKLIVINLSDNNLSKINKKTFHGNLDELEDLKLNYNRIDFIESGAFDDCPKLEMIDLSYNCLQKLSSDLFRKSSGLKFAHFTDNAITELAHDVFNSKTELLYLDLSNNKLKKIPEIALRIIDEFLLSNNEIELFDLNYHEVDVKKTPAIRHLRLSRNFISEFVTEFELNDHRSDIAIVDLAENYLKNIDDFPFFLNLEVLTLSNNNISDFSLYNFAEKFPNLKVLNIRKTLINCADFKYIRNTFAPLMVNVDDTLNEKCLHVNYHSNGSMIHDSEDYYDPILTKLLTETSQELSSNLIVNRVILIVILLLLASFGLAGIFIAVNFRVRMMKSSSELLNNIEL